MHSEDTILLKHVLPKMLIEWTHCGSELSDEQGWVSEDSRLLLFISARLGSTVGIADEYSHSTHVMCLMHQLGKELSSFCNR